MKQVAPPVIVATRPVRKAPKGRSRGCVHVLRRRAHERLAELLSG